MFEQSNTKRPEDEIQKDNFDVHGFVQHLQPNV